MSKESKTTQFNFKLPEIKTPKMNHAPNTKLQMNVGCLLDIPCCTLHTGMYGETIIEGGTANVMGIVGAPNLGKTAVSLHILSTAIHRCGLFTLVAYDTESTLNHTRIKKAMLKLTPQEEVDRLFDTGICQFASQASMAGEEFFDATKSFVNSKVNPKDKSGHLTSPFVEKFADPKEGNKYRYITAPIPTYVLIDSLSNFTVSDFTRMADDVKVGNSKENTFDMKLGKYRKRLITESVYTNPRTNTFTIMTAHIGRAIEVDPYNPTPKLLPSFKKGETFKGVGEAMASFTGNLWRTLSNSPLLTSSGELMFPKKGFDNESLDKDLVVISMYQMRGKEGPSDNIVKIVLSKTEGVLPTLSEFLYLRDEDYYGFESNGNNTHFRHLFLPNLSLTRTSIRDKIDEDPKLRRAINITSELLQLIQYNILAANPLYRDLICTPKELYDGIVQQGYNWDMILSKTRGWWTYQGIHLDTLFLSTIDLLKMSKGQYHPYWLEEDKKSIKKEYLY